MCWNPKEALSAAEIVVIPYNMLLSSATRQSIGLSLRSCLVLIDEAHNIPEVLRSISSSRVPLPIIESALNQLLLYMKKYKERLAERNIFYLGQIRRCLVSMKRFLNRDQERNQMMTSTELLFALKLDNMNLFKILKYLEKSRLSQKLLGFTNNIQLKEKESNETNLKEQENTMSKHVSALSMIQEFLVYLTGRKNEGKIIVEWHPKQKEADSELRSTQLVSVPSFRFVLLKPATQFRSILDEAHAVVLAGGTLRPFSHISTELLSCAKSEGLVKKSAEAEMQCETSLANGNSSVTMISSSLTTFTCNHVVPTSNVHISCLSCGPTNKQLDFRHSTRSSSAMCDELGRIVLNCCSVIPAGVVIFLPSYTYEAHIVNHWKKTGIFEKINRKKNVFREPKNPRHIEKCLATYSREAQSQNGSILLSVIGGKMSEGINFADDMARCVLVVGLPYPDFKCPEMREKMDSLDRAFLDGKSMISGQSYYQNLCMRALNQSIGRAIRHANDYAAIILVDKRYVCEPKIWNGLPFWLRKGQPKATQVSFGDAISGLHEFFNRRI